MCYCLIWIPTAWPLFSLAKLAKAMLALRSGDFGLSLLRRFTGNDNPS